MVVTYRTEELNYGKVLENIVNGTSKYLFKNGIKGQILGISGGIDSTLTAAICKLVSEKTSIPLIGASLPCHTNCDDEVESASLCGNEFCNEFKEINLQDLFVHAKNVFSSYGVENTPISQGNIKARLRGNFLHNLASIKNGIVIDTDNLTEHFLGFWTIAGGDEGELNPIGCLWKHEVYGLAKWMKENIYKESKALDAAIEIIPTDGNGVKAGGDLAQIAPGKTYDDVDEILHAWVGLDPRIKSHVIADNFSSGVFKPLCEKHGKETVEAVIMRSVRSEFKRKQRPFVIDIYNGNILEKNGNLM